MGAKRPEPPQHCACDTRKEIRLEEEVEELYENSAMFERWYEEEKAKSSDLCRQLAASRDRERKLREGLIAIGLVAGEQKRKVEPMIHDAIIDVVKFALR